MRFLRYSDLEAMGIVNCRPTLDNWIKVHSDRSRLIFGKQLSR